MGSQIPIHSGLFTWPAEQPQLLGSRCLECSEYAFPSESVCRNCGCTKTEVVPIGNRGTLWTWTIQSFLPKSPYNSPETAETFIPYGVGYVEMPCGLRVEARLCENQPEALQIGMAMNLVIEPFLQDESGNDIMIFAFRGDTQSSP